MERDYKLKSERKQMTWLTFWAGLFANGGDDGGSEFS